MPQLIPELTYYADLTADMVGTGPYGNRVIVNVTGGEVAGDRIKGTIAGTAGADWLLLGEDGFGRLDVRATIRTVDDAVIYVQYFGLLELTANVMGVLNGENVSTDFGEQYFFTNPRLETGDERYAFVNTGFFVGQGRVLPGPRVEYQVFRVEN